MAEYRIEFLKTAEKELAKLLEKGFKLLIKYKLLLMMPFEKCPVCSGELMEKKVTKLFKGWCKYCLYFRTSRSLSKLW
jgi:mRNA-degrading endonuclease RelE of RelBE toxin-antitoxin system